MLQVLYEDSDIIALNKPAGISVHPMPQHPGEKTLVAEILKRWPEIKNVGDPSTSSGQETLRPGIVHRLDKETSGVLVIAKTQAAFEYLEKQFQGHRIEKTYLALVIGKMPQKQGEIEMAIGRSKKFGKFTTRIGSKKYAAFGEGEPRPQSGREVRSKIREATTKWKTIKEFSGPAGETLSLLEIKPETGRTHQIRVHLAATGHPVVGDTLYGGRAAKKYRDKLGRHFLHALRLEFSFPPGRRLRIEAEPPPELNTFLKKMIKFYSP